MTLPCRHRLKDNLTIRLPVIPIECITSWATEGKMRKTSEHKRALFVWDESLWVDSG